MLKVSSNFVYISSFCCLGFTFEIEVVLICSILLRIRKNKSPLFIDCLLQNLFAFFFLAHTGSDVVLLRQLMPSHNVIFLFTLNLFQFPLVLFSIHHMFALSYLSNICHIMKQKLFLFKPVIICLRVVRIT